MVFFFFAKFCLSSEQIAEKDPDVRVQEVRDQEGIVPRPFSQLHPLRPLPGRGLHHLRVHEAGPPPELAAGSSSLSTLAHVLGVTKQININASFFEWLISLRHKQCRNSLPLM